MAYNTRDVAAKTADYTIVAGGDEGMLFTNRGAAGTITFTLPATPGTGWWCEFFTAAAQSIVIATATTDTLMVHADLTADSVTTAATIGQGARVVFDGTGYMFFSLPSAASTATAVTAVTIAT